MGIYTKRELNVRNFTEEVLSPLLCVRISGCGKSIEERIKKELGTVALCNVNILTACSVTN